MAGKVRSLLEAEHEHPEHAHAEVSPDPLCKA